MNKTVLRAVVLLVVVVALATAVKLLLPVLEEDRQKTTSDATHIKGRVTLALDNWVGYFPLRSSRMASLMRQAGYHLVVEDDQADYATRMQRLRDGTLDFAVATVDSFLLNGAVANYPGVIVMVIDESQGGDAILARRDKISSLDDLRRYEDVTVAFTPASPSHYLAKAAAEHFNLPQLLPQGRLRLETSGSEKAREALLNQSADVAICWEPDVSFALANPDIVKILGTEDTQGLIVDILLASRRIVQSQPELVRLLLHSYFQVLKEYREQPDVLVADVRKLTGLPTPAVQAMLGGVHWVNFNANCDNWFGIGSGASEGLVDTIEATLRVLLSAGDFQRNPLPGQDPYRLINSSFLTEMHRQGFTAFDTAAARTSTNSLENRFGPLSEAAWQRLAEIGTLKVAPIMFQSGMTELDALAKQVVDEAAGRLKHYPNFRVRIEGHTGTRGDATENMRLSRERAEAVARYLTVVYNVDPNRLKTQGWGGSKPLPQLPGESLRAWTYRLPRVELVLVREEI